MAGAMRLISAGAFLLLSHSALADHPCTTEVASACADRPGADIGACLKDPEEHDYPTEISSGCTDFIALNKGCAEDIEQFCEAGPYTDDTLLCLSKWTPLDHLSEKCQKVLSWAAPDAVVEGDEPLITDELGLSDDDYKEKKEWQAKRKKVREEAIDRIKMKEVDKRKEEDRVALEDYRKNDPEGYASMIQQQEEEKRQQINFKRQERARAAALERQKNPPTVDEEAEKAAASNGDGKKGPNAKKKGSWAYTIFSFVVLAGIGGIAYVLITGQKSSGGGGGGGSVKKGPKKKRG